MKHRYLLFVKLTFMLQNKILLYTFIVFSMTVNQATSQTDSTKMTFSGSLGLTNNGFSIIPTFSLNSPAAMIFLSWRKEKFSIDPDIRITPDGRKGGLLLWFRYHAINKKKFQFRAGFHPAMNLQIRKITENGVASEITQMRRFLAWELAPNIKLNKYFSTGLYYLQGNGLQKDGPRTSHFINLYTSLNGLPLGQKIKVSITPAVYYLKLDGYEGKYFTAAATFKHTDIPFSVQSAINQTLESNIPGNKEFLWNVSLNYHFLKNYRRIQ